MEMTHSGLVCDNPNCDWQDRTIKNEDLAHWVNASCPKCGENVLTEEDYENHLVFEKIIQMVEGMDEDTKMNLLEQFGALYAYNEFLKETKNKDVKLEVKIHNGIHTKFILDEKDQ